MTSLGFPKAMLLAVLVGCGTSSPAPSDDDADRDVQRLREPVEEPPAEITETTETTGTLDETQTEADPEVEPPKPPAEQPAPIEPAKPTGAKKGEVCRSSTGEGKPTGKAVNRRCAKGLQCCYPCGIGGCDWVCATQATCNSWRTLP